MHKELTERDTRKIEINKAVFLAKIKISVGIINSSHAGTPKENNNFCSV